MANQHVRKCPTRYFLTPAAILDCFPTPSPLLPLLSSASLLPPLSLNEHTNVARKNRNWNRKTLFADFVPALSTVSSKRFHIQAATVFGFPPTPAPPPPQQAMLFYAPCPVGIILMVDSLLGICLVFFLCFALLSRNGNCFTLSLSYSHTLPSWPISIVCSGIENA